MSKTTILVIDDEPSNIQVIINLLQKPEYNYKILSSSNSELSLEIAKSAKPDIIITDWEMPGLTGIDVILELKKDVVTKEIPVIMATGVKMTSSDLKLALESGAFDFIRKPYDEIEMIARVNSALRFVNYYKEKIENEKQITKIKEEQSIFEIESKKREILAKTMLLIKISQLNMKFYNRFESIDRSSCKPECSFYCEAKNYTKEIIDNGGNQIWNELELHFEQINEIFYRNITGKFPTLTQNEKKLCAYLRLNLSTKDIATISNGSIRSIEIARTRLREKLGLKGSDEDLHSFLLKF